MSFPLWRSPQACHSPPPFLTDSLLFPNSRLLLAALFPCRGYATCPFPPPFQYRVLFLDAVGRIGRGGGSDVLLRGDVLPTLVFYVKRGLFLFPLKASFALPLNRTLASSPLPSPPFASCRRCAQSNPLFSPSTFSLHWRSFFPFLQPLFGVALGEWISRETLFSKGRMPGYPDS